MPNIYSAIAPDSQALDALDRPLEVTWFPTRGAFRKKEYLRSLRALEPRIRAQTKPTKAALPWLKLGAFGKRKTDKGCLRHNANMLSIDGIEADYDGGTMPMEIAAARLRAADIAALLYTSPSHTDAVPRWRVLCPASASLPPERRRALVARLNGVLGGTLDPSSFTLSQAFHYGSVNENPAPRVLLVEGRYIDLAEELDANAIGPARAQAIAASGTIEADDDPLSQDRPEPEWPKIEAALDAIPVDEREDRPLWLRIGMALHYESGGSEDGFDRWDDWSSEASVYKADDQRRVWESFGNPSSAPPIQINTLYWTAQQYGWDGNAKPELEQAKPPAPSGLRFLSPGECDATPRGAYVLKGMLAPGNMAAIIGEPGAGKSLIGPYLGYMVALGLPAFGMRTKGAGVFYVAAEDPHGMAGRVAALKLEHGDAPDFELVMGLSDLLAEGSADLPALLAAIEERKPALIFLDTVQMAFPGLEENEAAPMGRVVRVARELAQHGAAVVLIHHPAKGGDTPRGHGSLNGALDVSLLVSQGGDGVIRGKLKKNRNGTSERDIAFRIGVRELGTDDDGDAITAPLVEELTPSSTPRAEGPTDAEAAALAVLRELIGPDADGRTSEQGWREACTSRRSLSGSDKPNTQWRAMDRAVKGLVLKGLVEVRDGLAWVPGGAIEADFEDDE